MEAMQSTFVLSSPQDMITLSQCTESVYNIDPLDCRELKPNEIYFVLTYGVNFYKYELNSLYASVLITHADVFSLVADSCNGNWRSDDHTL